MTTGNYWQRKSISRRRLLRYATIGGIGFGAAAVIGCGEEEQAPQSPAPTTTATTGAQATSTQPAAGPTNVGSLQFQGQQFSKEWWESLPAEIKEPAGTPQRGGVFRLRYGADIPHSDPTFTAAHLQAGVYNLAYNKPVQYKVGSNARYNNIEIDPRRGLAESVEISDDGLTYIFKFKPGIKWQNLPPVNGRDFVAEDVRWTYDHYINEPGTVEAAFFTDIDKMEAVDARTLRITLKERNADFLFSMASPYLPILPREVYERDGDFRQTIVGTGPFQLKEWTRDTRLVFERNPNYTVNKGPNGEQLPYLDGVEIAIIPDASTGSAAFRTGEIRQAWGSGVALDDWPEIFKSKPDLMAQRIIYRGGTVFFLPHLKEQPWNDVRFRRALSIAFNYQQVWQTLFPKSGVPSPGAIVYWYMMGMDRNPTFEEMGQWFLFNPELAKQLMKEAGFEQGFDLTVNRQSGSAGAVELAQQFWKQVLNINVNIMSESYTQNWAATTSKSWQGLQYISINLGFSLDEVTRQTLHSTSPRNYIDLNDPTMDDLVTRQKLEFDQEKRQQLARQIWERYNDNVYAIITPAGGYQAEVWYPNIRNYRYYGVWISEQYKQDQMEEVWLENGTWKA